MFWQGSPKVMNKVLPEMLIDRSQNIRTKKVVHLYIVYGILDLDPKIKMLLKHLKNREHEA